MPNSGSSAAPSADPADDFGAWVQGRAKAQQDGVADFGQWLSGRPSTTTPDGFPRRTPEEAAQLRQQVEGRVVGGGDTAPWVDPGMIAVDAMTGGALPAALSAPFQMLASGAQELAGKAGLPWWGQAAAGIAAPLLVGQGMGRFQARTRVEPPTRPVAAPGATEHVVWPTEQLPAPGPRLPPERGLPAPSWRSDQPPPDFIGLPGGPPVKPGPPAVADRRLMRGGKPAPALETGRFPSPPSKGLRTIPELDDEIRRAALAEARAKLPGPPRPPAPEPQPGDQTSYLPEPPPDVVSKATRVRKIQLPPAPPKPIDWEWQNAVSARPVGPKLGTQIEGGYQPTNDSPEAIAQRSARIAQEEAERAARLAKIKDDLERSRASGWRRASNEPEPEAPTEAPWGMDERPPTKMEPGADIEELGQRQTENLMRSFGAGEELVQPRGSQGGKRPQYVRKNVAKEREMTDWIGAQATAPDARIETTQGAGRATAYDRKTQMLTIELETGETITLPAGSYFSYVTRGGIPIDAIRGMGSTPPPDAPF